MAYIVVWSQAAAAALQAILIRSADKPGDWAHVQEIEARLRIEPLTAGEGREPPYRLLFVRPFELLYRVDEGARTVSVEELQWVGQ